MNDLERQCYQYTFSVVMSVYNVESYIEEAINSLINQTIGFENIQLILVDDGSTDKSGKICDEYAEKYRENIKVIHQENHGLSYSRMVGLKFIEGEYISFFDPDDILSENTLQTVYEFLIEHYAEIDVVCIPLYFFGEKTGQHPLNDKFRQGTRIIDLQIEPEAILLSCASAFYTREAVKLMDFDLEIVTAEDAKENVKILLEKQKIGVVSNVKYRYRKRSDSNVGSAQSKKGWYGEYLDRYSYWAIEYCMQKLGCVPKFVQYMIMYDLQWKYLAEEIPQGVLSEDEIELYRKKLFEIVNYIDDSVIMDQKNMYVDQKLFLLYRKYNREPDYFIMQDKTIYYGYNNYIWGNYNASISHLNFMKIINGQLIVEADQITFDREKTPLFFFQINGNEMIETEILNYKREIKSAGIVIACYHHFRGAIPLDTIEEKVQVRIITRYESFDVEQRRVAFGKYLPITDKCKNSYYEKDGVLIQSIKGGFSIKKVSEKEKKRKEKLYRNSLKECKNIRARNALLTRIFYKYLKPLMPNDIWLIMDKSNRADDNGEAFFKYVLGLENKKCHPIFVIGKNTEDYKRMKKIGRVVPYMSYRHKILFLFAEYVISAYSHDEVSTPYLVHNCYYSNLIQDSKIVFLQHGITKDDLSPGLNKVHKNYTLFVTSTEQERNSVVSGNYGYTDEQVILTGLPRYDLLYNDPKKVITIMPTWKRDLCGVYDPHTSIWTLRAGFEKSQYYQFYNKLISSKELIDFAEEKGYRIQFLVHPVFQPYIEKFTPDERVKMLGADTIYRKVFAESSLIITDYSSVAFDFAYLYKPVLYTHFESNHYVEGYFDYENDGFGEITHNLEDTIEKVKEYIENDCKLKAKYRERIEKFYAYHDKENSKRVYEKIIKLRMQEKRV